MKLAIFGATGRTGKHLVEQALAADHDVIAFVRNPSKLTTTHEHLTVVHGDATDPVAVERAVHSTDAVISAMATPASQKIARTQPLTRGTQNILAAMKKHGVRRLIITSAGIPQPNDSPDLRFSLMMGFGKLIMRASYDDTIGSAHAVRASDVDWTIVRIAGPTNAPRTGRVQAGYVNKTIGTRVGRADAAAFMLNEVRAAQYIRQAPVIWGRR
jgi:nucleoside-diphosphate-sugar epimerase